MKCTTYVQQNSTHTRAHTRARGIVCCHCDEGSLIGDVPANEYFHTYMFQERHYAFLDFTKVAIFFLRAFQLVREELFGSLCPHPFHVELHSVLIKLGLNAITRTAAFRGLRGNKVLPSCVYPQATVGCTSPDCTVLYIATLSCKLTASCTHPPHDVVTNQCWWQYIYSILDQYTVYILPPTLISVEKLVFQ